MPTNAEELRQKFWKTLNFTLEEKGNPFYFTEFRQWAVINRRCAYNFHEPCIALDYLCKYKYLRINVYIENNLRLYNLFKTYKDNIESQLGFKCIWQENTPDTNGERRKFKGANTRRIEIRLNFCPTLKELAEKAIPIIEKFIEVFRGYIKFDE